MMHPDTFYGGAIYRSISDHFAPDFKLSRMYVVEPFVAGKQLQLIQVHAPLTGPFVGTVINIGNFPLDVVNAAVESQGTLAALQMATIHRYDVDDWVVEFYNLVYS